MKPLYFKIIEESQVKFIKVVKSGDNAIAGFLIRSSQNNWTSYPKMFDLNKEKDKRDYAELKKRCLESNKTEFDEASKEAIKQARL